MDQRIAPSVQIEAAIEAVLTGGLADPGALSTLGRLGAQLVLQRAVEDEVAAFLRRSRYERAPDAAGSRNSHRPRRVQTAEGEITINMPQVRDSLTRFVSSVIPDTKGIIRTRPLEVRISLQSDHLFRFNPISRFGGFRSPAGEAVSALT